MNAIEIAHLSKTFKGKKLTKVEALKGINLEIGRGEVFGFLGPNGAGKSTTIKILTGQIRSGGGEARILGVPVIGPTARRQIGYLPENPAFYDFLTAREYLRFVGRTFAMDENSIRVESDRVLALLDLLKAADRPMRGFSKGMVQRLGLAQVLLHDPQVCILDEPMSGLDPMGRALVKEIIKGLKKQGKTVFFSTHITADVEMVCDRVGVIAGGRLLAVDSVANILQSGVEGYIVQVSRPDGTVEEMIVEKLGMQSAMQQFWAEGAAIERIEPKRRDLEAFFLDIVARAQHEDQR
jgi:ABC-2 type transport system ATP-binding protein